MPVNWYHSLVLDGSGNHFFACGKNDHGQLGTGDTIQKEKFTQVLLPVKFISLSAGFQAHSLGIAECDGSLWSWGSNQFGQLGQGEGVPNLTQPTQFLTLIRLFKFLLDTNFHWPLIRMNTFGRSEMMILAVWDWEKEWTIFVFGCNCSYRTEEGNILSPFEGEWSYR